MQRIIHNPNAGTIERRRVASGTCVSLVIALLVLGSLRPLFAQPASEEYKVKAAFIFHFAQLVDWPGGALNGDVDFCIFDDEPHRQELQTTLRGKLIGVRVINVRVLSQEQGFQGCNIVFLSRAEGRRQDAVLRSLRGSPVLTVGETDDFLSAGGMIHFHLDGDKIRFDINANVADSAHLRISSRLLLLATSVTHGVGTDVGKASYAH